MRIVLTPGLAGLGSWEPVSTDDPDTEIRVAAASPVVGAGASRLYGTLICGAA